MKRTPKVVAALVAALLPISLATPAFAVEYDRLNITVDCVLGEVGEDDHVLRPGDVLNVTFTNCSGLTIEDEDDTGNATMPDNTVIVSGNTQTISSNSFVVTVEGAADLEVDDDSPDVDVKLAGTVDDPSSTLLATEEITIELSASETMIREEAIGTPGDNGYGEIYMDGKEQCEVEPGLHVYEALEFIVTTAGTYDFRAVAVSPIDDELNWGVDRYPSSDPFLAVYETFNPALPETEVVGCNDDGDNSGITEVDAAWSGEDGLVTDAGDLLHDEWPWFRTTLEPGNYTLVYMPFSTAGTEDFAAGRFASSSGSTTTWDPIAQTVTYEMWGPAGGIVFGEELATTGGVEPSFALWAGIGIVGVGVAVAVARRREQRA